MTTLFDSARPVKTARTFGQGIPTARRARFNPSPEDAQWWAENAPGNDRDYDVIDPTPSDAELDQAAGCALAQARLDAGFTGFF